MPIKKFRPNTDKVIGTLETFARIGMSYDSAFLFLPFTAFEDQPGLLGTS